MSKINDGGYAFPQALNGDDDYNGAEGMSLRDWFAGQALAGLCMREDALHPNEDSGEPESLCAISQVAWQYADEMLFEGKKGGEE